MKKFRVVLILSALAIALSGCGLFGGSDGTDVTVAEDLDAQPTVNNVQSVPAETPATDQAGAGDDTTDGEADGDGAALPTAVTLPTPEPTLEPTPDRSQPTTYIVQSGDVLGLIAERFDVDIAELRRVNNLDGNLIRVGQELTIPAADGSTAAADDDDSDSSGSGDTASGSGSPAATSAPAATVTCGSSAGHCIQPGESLTGIALQYDITVEELRAANPGIVDDLIRSGDTLNLPGSSAADPTPAATAAPGTTTVPDGTPVAPGPSSDAECAARNPDFPYYHAADGLCYANPIGSTTVPTAVGSDDDDDDCPPGRFLWEDGLCYPIPGVTVTPTAGPTPTTPASALPDYGTAPCRDGYVPLESGRCWPEPETTPATVTPAAAAPTGTATSSGSTVACVEPNFTESASGTCFLLQAGVDAGCSIENGEPKCP